MIALGFDFDHTLGVDSGLERKALYAYAAELGHPLDPHDDTWRARIESLLARFRLAESPHAQVTFRDHDGRVTALEFANGGAPVETYARVEPKGK